MRRNRAAAVAGAIAGLIGLVALLSTALAATGGPAAAPPAQPNPNCTLTVPADPLSAQGLATPYRLTATDPAQGPCNEANTDQSAFVQATVVNPATGALSVYDPLVVDQGTRPAAAPVVPVLPRGAVVGIWFGFNGTDLTLRADRGSLGSGRCVNGFDGTLFTQFAYCDAPAFFAAADADERAGKLAVPPLGTGRDGRTCMSTRDFGLVDQDQSDNVTTNYLATADGRIAQDTAANAAALPGAASLANGSDNLLLDAFVDPALGCSPFTAPDLVSPGQQATSLGLDELQAAADQAAPVALVPLNDPMTLVDGRQSRTKTDLYRAGVGQPPVSRAATGSPALYCTDIFTIGTARIDDDQSFFVGAPSLQEGQDLFDFLTQRLAASLVNLGCPQASASASAPAVIGSATAIPPTATPSSGRASGSGGQP